MIDMNDESLLLSRRTLMAGGVAAGVAASLSAPAMASTAAPPGPLDNGGIPTDPATRAAIVRRMRLRHDTGHVFWWFRGTSYAQQGANLIPLCDMVAETDPQMARDPLAIFDREEATYRN
ncbi:hypothetical protein [uncultured Parasphingorhabdus sp.]|uniref:hypothetical protein n=1 Tax=uncultured Parasphingorhabdus sp. TaxID=2709694 RepID=UPI0030D7368C|tara:strand:- start:90730 stop:91089 length:360 start_codon:yes stop_codon:yes gene_type:complete